MKKIQENIHFLYVLVSSSKQQRESLIKTVSKSQLQALLEVIFNTLKGTVTLTTKNKELLSRYKKVIRKVVDPHTSLRQRRALLYKFSSIFIYIVKIVLSQINFKNGTRTGIGAKRRI